MSHDHSNINKTATIKVGSKIMFFCEYGSLVETHTTRPILGIVTLLGPLSDIGVLKICDLNHGWYSVHHKPFNGHVTCEKKDLIFGHFSTGV